MSVWGHCGVIVVLSSQGWMAGVGGGGDMLFVMQ